MRAGTLASSSPSSGCSSVVSLTDSRYESVATIRSSLPDADTRTPVRCGRVSSREAERATRLIVSTNAATGRASVEPPGSGSFGKSSSGSVRRWNFAVPETTSTSCCDERYSSESSSFGSDRTTSSRSRPGTTASPSRSDLAGAETRSRAPCRWPGARPGRRSARTSTPDSVWMALRVDTPRAATPRLATNCSHEIENFITGPV